ncbi:2'-5' RNA ligase family protein [Bacillus sp. Xin]|uniref:2'-5' RNA ligase family protein n=1 Tax=unclassified Bacillus (in: firmicutes) TaxID=185979 RepID=UPI001572E67B|nr:MULTISPECIES: 2'-5' RNA ligase family protein [unclassified Bacillus (in: firmicutes)]MBC6975029.1 2'-5' RNA ligase family protein [Bacillus sp. Xin]NSW37762.1 2'-5' RNA ligase family protein [Bacillus sp. Xin1]
MYAVIAAFDERFSKHVKEIREERINIGHNEDLEPHIKLADYHTLDLKLYGEKLEKFTEHIECFPVEFSSVGTFPTNGTIFLAPIVTGRLLELHQSFHNHFVDFHDQPQSYYVPGKWVPHCTIATRLKREQFVNVMDFIYKDFKVQKAVIESLKLIRINYENSNPISCSVIAEYTLKSMEKSI